MYSKFVLAIRFCLAEMAILVGKWPMADCYFKLCSKGQTYNLYMPQAYPLWVAIGAIPIVQGLFIRDAAIVVTYNSMI